jgi:hypothetical protein
LHLSGAPVSQCSTSRLFAYITHYGAQPLGLEWIDDSSCNIVFSDSSAARLAIEYLCPAVSTSYSPLIPLPNDQALDEAVNRKKRLDDPNEEQDNEEWSSILLQSLLSKRKAHRIPAKLYSAPERDAAADARRSQDESSGASAGGLPSDVPEIYREMEEEDRKKQRMRPEQRNLQKLRGSLWVRWALESLDVKPSKSAKQSKWYQEHGNDAGKEVVTKLLSVGGIDERLELLPSNNSRRRNDKARWDDLADTSRGRGSRQVAMDDLDADLDTWRESEGEKGPVDETTLHKSSSRHQQRGGRNERRGRMTLDALDEELERNQRDRSASPVRRERSDLGYPRDSGGTVKVKGRGRMKAPSVWDDDGDGSSSNYYQKGLNGGDSRRRKHDTHQTLQGRMSQSLAERMQGGGGNDLLNRLG